MFQIHSIGHLFNVPIPLYRARLIMNSSFDMSLVIIYGSFQAMRVPATLMHRLKYLARLM